MEDKRRSGALVTIEKERKVCRMGEIKYGFADKILSFESIYKYFRLGKVSSESYPFFVCF